MHMTKALPPVLFIARMQKFGDRFILAEDSQGRHFIVDRRTDGPVREVVYFEHYPPKGTHC